MGWPPWACSLCGDRLGRGRARAVERWTFDRGRAAGQSFAFCAYHAEKFRTWTRRTKKLGHWEPVADPEAETERRAGGIVTAEDFRRRDPDEC